MASMRILLLALLLVAQSKDEKTYPVTISFKSLSCAGCRQAAEAGLKALAGVKKVTVDEGKNRISVRMLEKTPLRLSSVRKVVPSDLKIVRLEATLRGVVRVEGDKMYFLAKESGQDWLLRNPPKDGDKEIDVLTPLRKKVQGGDERFRLTCLVREDKRLKQKIYLAVKSFEVTTWKDE